MSIGYGRIAKLKPISIRYLSGHDVFALVLKEDGIPAATETSLLAWTISSLKHARQAVDKTRSGHFNLLRA